LALGRLHGQNGPKEWQFREWPGNWAGSWWPRPAGGLTLAGPICWAIPRKTPGWGWPFGVLYRMTPVEGNGGNPGVRNCPGGPWEPPGAYSAHRARLPISGLRPIFGLVSERGAPGIRAPKSGGGGNLGSPGPSCVSFQPLGPKSPRGFLGENPAVFWGVRET